MRVALFLCALAVLLVPAPATGQGVTAAHVREEARKLLDETAAQWAQMRTPAGDFANPFAADLARGHGPFSPPTLIYALHSVGERTGDKRLVRTAEAAWPRAVDPVRASAFDLIGAAYAYRRLKLTAGRRAHLGAYLSSYGLPTNGARCLTRPRCYSNLKLADALAVLLITGSRLRSANPAARLANPAAARKAALEVVNRRAPVVTDHLLRARLAGLRLRGTVLSDPPADPLAYHALTALLLSEAVAELGAEARPRAQRTRWEALDALSVLMAPDGDTSYLGRGQDQVWVPAVTAAALATGTRDAALAGDLPRAGRYLAGVLRALQRLITLHPSTRGLTLVPGQATRTTTAGIDAYAHTVAYNGLALWALSIAFDALDQAPDVPLGALPADGPIAARDPDASGLAVVADGALWMAVHRTATYRHDLRHDVGALVLQQRIATGWRDLLAPRPQTVRTSVSGGPALLFEGRAITPTGYDIRVRGRTVTIPAAYRRRGRNVRRVTIRWRLTRSGARMTLRGARPGDRFRMVAFTPAGTGTVGPRELVAADTAWRFDRTIRTRRLPGFHAAAIEHLDGLEAVVRVHRARRFVLWIEAPAVLPASASGRFGR